jgi:hypothetical protein
VATKCHKHRFWTKLDAMIAAAKMKSTKLGVGESMRIYRCPHAQCKGAYHLTSKSKKKQK